MNYFMQGSIENCEPVPILMEEDSTVVARQDGDLKIPFEDANVTLLNDFLIPELGWNRISVGVIADRGIFGFFDCSKGTVILEEEPLLIGTGERDSANCLYRTPYSIDCNDQI